jgi:hypothetical protein
VHETWQEKPEKIPWENGDFTSRNGDVTSRSWKNLGKTWIDMDCNQQKPREVTIWYWKW